MTEEALVASALRTEFKVPPTVDLYDLAQKLELEIVEVDLKSFDGALLRSRTSFSGRILVRSGIRELGRKRFTIAHEIGHYILHGDQQNSCSPRVIEGWKEGQPAPEREADTFASELLLPTTDVTQHVNRRWPSMQVVSNIADRYGASMMAAGRKFCDVASQPCALVWSSQRVIRWFHPSPSFVNFIEPGASLGFDSLALAAHEGRTPTDQMEEVPAEAWLKSSWLKEDAVVSEQSIFMPSYEGCLSLIWIRRTIEQKPTVEDELLPELDPEGFTLNRKRWPR
jgi:IrrE N-terminal-like domain